MIKKLDPSRLSNYMFVTVLIMIVSAWIGALIGAALISTTLIMASFALGPLAILTAVPLALSQAVFAYGGTFVVPLWALFGGSVFSANAAANAAKADSSKSGVTLFAETHQIHTRVNQLASELDLPEIRWVGWFEEDAINAFAMGVKQDEALIAFSRGAIETLTFEELDAVIAHELAHVANNDMARMTYGHGVQDALTWFLMFRGLKKYARWVFTPISELELMRFSRKREFYADAIGAVLISPEAMAGALEKIEKQKSSPPKELKHLSQFMFQSNAHSFFDTHPKTSERISAIQSREYIKHLPMTEFEAAKLGSQSQLV